MAESSNPDVSYFEAETRKNASIKIKNIGCSEIRILSGLAPRMIKKHTDCFKKNIDNKFKGRNNCVLTCYTKIPEIKKTISNYISNTHNIQTIIVMNIEGILSCDNFIDLIVPIYDNWETLNEYFEKSNKKTHPTYSNRPYIYDFYELIQYIKYHSKEIIKVCDEEIDISNEKDYEIIDNKKEYAYYLANHVNIQIKMIDKATTYSSFITYVKKINNSVTKLCKIINDEIKKKYDKLHMLLEEWTPKIDYNGFTYYFNNTTKQIQREYPLETIYYRCYIAPDYFERSLINSIDQNIECIIDEYYDEEDEYEDNIYSKEYIKLRNIDYNFDSIYSLHRYLSVLDDEINQKIIDLNCNQDNRVYFKIIK